MALNPATIPSINIYRNREWTLPVTVNEDVTGFDLALVVIQVTRTAGSNPPVLTSKSPTGLSVSSGVSSFTFIFADAATANLSPLSNYQWQCLGRETGSPNSDVLQSGAVVVLDSPVFPS